MNISVFLSYSKPYNANQENFVKSVMSDLRERGMDPRTLGVTDYDLVEPLAAIRKMMMDCNGVLVIAFRRALVEKGKIKPDTQMQKKITNEWLTSSFCQIEPAMAYQLGLPVMILREKGVIADGVLERGVLGIYLPEFELDSGKQDFLKTDEWKQMVDKWKHNVNNTYNNKGRTPKLY